MKKVSFEPKRSRKIRFEQREAVKPKPEAIPMEEIWHLGESLEDLQDRALFFFLYVSGGRISEALRIQSRDFRMEEVVLHDNRRIKTITIDSITLKKRNGIRRRKIFLFPYGIEMKMLQEINRWRDTRVSDDSLLFDYGEIGEPKIGTARARTRAFHRIRDKLQVQVRATRPDGEMVVLPDFQPNLHYLRHCRATHLVEVYGLSAEELKAWFNWSKIEMAGRYVHTTSLHALERMLNNLPAPQPVSQPPAENDP